jgi:hypothetical protein
MAEKKKPLKAGDQVSEQEGVAVKENKEKEKKVKKKSSVSGTSAKKQSETKKILSVDNKKSPRKKLPSATSEIEISSIKEKRSERNIIIQAESAEGSEGNQDIFSNLEFGFKNKDVDHDERVSQGKDSSIENSEDRVDQLKEIDNEKTASASKELNPDDSEVFYLSDEHKKVIRSIFANLYSDSPFCFLGSFDKTLLEYYKEIIFDLVRKSDAFSILYFDPKSGPDLLTIINGALKNFDLGDMQFSRKDCKRTILALDNENSIKGADWELLDVLRVELKEADMGVFCVRPQTFGDDFVDKVTQMVKKFKSFNLETLSVLEFEHLEEVIVDHKENEELQRVFSALQNEFSIDQKKQATIQSANSIADGANETGLSTEDSFIDKFFKKIRHRE